MLSQAMENYLKVIYEILEREDRATTSVIAERMGIASPSATAMVKKLASLNLLTHEPYQGVELTQIGRKAALEVVRHHRLLELYLSEALGVPWDKVHDEAEKLEHVISEDLEDRIAAALGHPTTDPHGAPIPARDGTVHRVASRRLTEVPAGSTVRVVEVEDRDPEFLRYLGSLDVFPGAEITVVAQGPSGIHLRRGDAEFSLKPRIAADIDVTVG